VVIGVVAGMSLSAGFLMMRPPAAGAAPVQAEFRIEGMDCLMCAAGLQNKLRAVQGVAAAEVSYQDKLARVTFDPARTSRERLAAAIEGDGFKVGGAAGAAAPPHGH
jgi:copper chaperone CopZ